MASFVFNSSLYLCSVDDCPFVFFSFYHICKANLMTVIGKIFAGKSSSDSDSPSLTVAASNKILVPGSQGDGSLSLTDQLDNPETVLEDPQV